MGEPSRVWLFTLILVPLVFFSVPTDGLRQAASDLGTATNGQAEEAAPEASEPSEPDKPEIKLDSAMLAALSVEWQPIERDKLGNGCYVRGRLLFPDAQQAKSLAGQIHAILYMSRQSEVKRDWSGGAYSELDLIREAEVTAAGEFRFHVDLLDLESRRDVNQSFQRGLAVEMSDAADRDLPAIPSSVGLQQVPSAPPLPPEMEVICRTRGWPFENPNSVDLIQAVNVLQAMGKERALGAIERYIAISEGHEHFYRSDHLFWILRLLFEPIELGKRRHGPAIAVYLVDSRSVDAASWPLEPLELVDDIPFMVGRRIALGGMPEHPSKYIQWVREHAIIRQYPLQPSTNPIAAAQKLTSSNKFKQLFDREGDWRQYTRDNTIGEIQNLALAMLPGILSPLPEDIYERSELDPLWQARVDEAAHYQIIWDKNSQQFVRIEKPK